SGRQYESLRRLFAPVADRILYSCENGSIVYYHDAVLAKTPLPRDQCAQLTAQILAQPGCEVLISGANTCYVAPKSEAYFHHISEELGNNTRRIACLDDVPEEVIKISAFCDKPAAEYEAMFAPVWDHHLNVAVAGKFWLDFTLAHKGTALAQISDALSLSARDMLAFGDNFNDIPMFRFAGDSYAMENADPAVKAAAAHTCSSVLQVLETL
ncbi:MAG: HAD family hydrolase, partial [Ruthenibacterium sp.]